MDSKQNQAQARDLTTKLWAIANDLRGNMDSSKFKNYILGVIFYKYLSERTEMYMEEILKNDDLSYEEAFNNEDFRPVVEQWSLEHLGYIITPNNLFRELVRKIDKPMNDEDRFSIENFERAINELTGSTMGQKSEAAFSGLFSDMRLQDTDLGDTVSERTSLISKVIAKINEIDFDLKDSKFDVLGAAYMILIGLFQSDAGKKGGEFFTPDGPADLCARLATIGLTEAKTVADSCLGSASMLLRVGQYVKVGHYYGQEKIGTNYNMGRMNLLMHGVDYQKFTVFKGDTLTTDNYDDIQMVVQVENPPYSLKWDADPKFDEDPRYSGAGKLAPKSHADLAFLEHMIYHMDENDGRIAILLPHGVLFRGGAEEAIRKYIIQTLNRLDAVIGLPANLFHGTSIPVCLLVLKSDRSGNEDNILFIDASKEYTAGKNQNTLEESHKEKIVQAYIDRKDIEKYAHVATMEEIEDNGFNLNIPRYVDTSAKEEEIDLTEVSNKLKDIDKEIEIANKELKKYFDELGLDFPFGKGN